jgi:membrane-bound lytic murein transglycosylase B
MDTVGGIAGRLLMAATCFALVGCSVSAPPAPPSTPTAAAPPVDVKLVDQTTAQPRLSPDPAQLARDLVADEQTIRNPQAGREALIAAARRQQAAYRAIGFNRNWDGVIRPLIPASLQATYDRNVDARRQLTALAETRDTVPAWRIVSPAPPDELLGYYRAAEAAFGVGWNYLAAINLVETRFGSVNGVSTAGAQGPMQFMPSTFAAYGDGGDIHSARDSIMAAGRYLAANGFVSDPDHALFRYNNADEYVRAINDYAAVLASDPGAFAGYYLWDVYYRTTAGDIVLPIGYVSMTPIPATEYLATHPQ